MLELSQVSFNYSASAPVIKQVSFQVKKGDFIALLGANKTGKSTLCKLMTSLLVPTAGKIITQNASAPLMALMLANPEDQLICPLVEEELAFGLQNLALPNATISERVHKYLDLLQLTPLRRKTTNLLSGGEQQKVIIAALLALQPQCLILDEATSFLDPAQQQLVREVILKLHRQHGFALIWSTPSVEEALQAKLIIILYQGKTVFQGTVNEFLQLGEKIQDWGLVWPDLYVLRKRLKLSTPGLLSAATLAQAISANPSVPQTNDCAQSNTNLSPIQITVKDLTYYSPYRQKGESPILKQINFTIREGEFWGISGHTGCGKSTLLQHLNGLYQPSGGQVFLHETDIHKNRQSLQSARRQIGLVFQYPERQFFNPSVAEEISFGLRQTGFKETEIEQTCEETLSWLNLDYKQLRNRSPHELSGAEKRKLAIACVLITKPRILILDEPTAGLDDESKREILQKISYLHQQQRLTTIMVSHDYGELINLASHLLLLKEGEIRYNGPTKQLLAKPEILTSLGLPLPALLELTCLLKQRQPDFAPQNLTLNSICMELEKHFPSLFDK